jgi:peptide/nickel transport system substrate-binding protein
MAHDVFISHSSKDKAVGDAVCATMEARGIRCWIAPRDIAPGADWGASIVNGISACRVMVLIYSAHSNRSEQVKREVERAVSRGKTVVPLRIEDTPLSPSLEYFVSASHWLDAMVPPLQRHLDRLAEAIGLLLPESPERPAPAPARSADRPTGHVARPTQDRLQADGAPAGRTATRGGRRLLLPLVLLALAAGAWPIYRAVRRFVPLTQAVTRPSATSDPGRAGVAAVPAKTAATRPGPTSRPGRVGAPRVSTPRAGSPQRAGRPDPFGDLKAAEARPDFARGDRLTTNLGPDLGVSPIGGLGALQLTPLVGISAAARAVQANVIESLVGRDPNANCVPQLAVDWRISDDGLTYTFQLRKGVKFSNGQPFTAADVIFTYGLAMNPNLAAAHLRVLSERITSVDKRNDHEVVFTLNEPHFQGLGLCGEIPILPEGFYAKFSESHFNAVPGLPLVGTGPYMMGGPGDLAQVELVRHDGYWGGPPTFDRLVFMSVDDAEAITCFRKGELDLLDVDPIRHHALLDDPQIAALANHYEYAPAAAAYDYIAWNQMRDGKPTRFADARVRRAMTMATDRDRLNDEVNLGHSTTTSGPFASGSPQADPAIRPVPYDPDGARVLLAESGYPREFGGVRLTYPSSNDRAARVALLLKESFAAAGVTLEPEPVEFPVLLNQIDTRDFDAVMLAWAGSIENDLYSLFDSSQIADRGSNFMSYSNPALDRIIRKARRTTDDTNRLALWHEAHRILADDQPYTFLTSRTGLCFVNKRIKNVQKSKVGLNYMPGWSMPRPWYAAESLQEHKD